MEEELERQYQEQMEEEKLINDEMLHDEEIALEKQKEKLEKDIFEIRMQLKENKILELRKKRGEEVNPRDEVWAIRATQALMIKKRNLKSKMIIQVHDELVFDCLKEEKDEIVNIMTNVMENVCKLEVPLKIEIEYGNNWYEAK